MPFFQELAAMMGDDKKIVIALSKEGDRLVCLVRFTAGEQEFQPITCSGTPEDFDESFIPRIHKAGAKVDGWTDDLKTFTAALKPLKKKAQKAAKKAAGRVEIKSTPAAKSNSGTRASQAPLL